MISFLACKFYFSSDVKPGLPQLFSYVRTLAVCFFDEVGGAFTNHGRRGVGIAGDDLNTMMY